MQTGRQSITSTNSSPGSLLQAKSSDVVKRGCLYVKRPPSNNPVRLRLKTWQKRYLVLRDMWTEDGDTVLELYNNEIAANNSVEGDLLRRPNNNNNNNQNEHCSVSLRNVIYVDIYTDSRSFPFAFIVLRSEKSPLIFGAKTDFEMREWMMAIKLVADKVSRPRHSTLTFDGTLGRGSATDQLKPPPPRVEIRSTLRKDGQMHRSTPQLLDSPGNNSPNCRTKKNNRPSPTDSKRERTSSDVDSRFLVRVQRTDDSSQRPLNGEYYMFVSDTEICLRRTPQTAPEETAISWPLQHIRKLKSEATTDGLGDLVTLVASSQCGQSQGTYTFRITSGLDLIRRVRMFAKRMEAVDSCCRRQQMDMAKLKKAASPSLVEKLLSSSSSSLLRETGSVNQSMQSLVMSSGSSSGSQLDQATTDDDIHRISSSSSQSHMYCFTGNSYLPIVDDTGNLAPPGDTLSGKRVMTLSRSMGSLGFLSTTSRRIDSGFESSEEVVALTVCPPIPPPRPVHTIGLN